MSYDPTQFRWRSQAIAAMSAEELQQALCRLIDEEIRYRESQICEAAPATCPLCGTRLRSQAAP